MMDGNNEAAKQIEPEDNQSPTQQTDLHPDASTDEGNDDAEYLAAKEQIVQAVQDQYLADNLPGVQAYIRDAFPVLTDAAIANICRPATRLRPDPTLWTENDTIKSRSLWKDHAVKQRLDSEPAASDSLTRSFMVGIRYIRCSPLQLIGPDFGLQFETKIGEHHQYPDPLRTESFNKLFAQLMVYPSFMNNPGTLALVIGYAALQRRNESRSCVFINDSTEMFLNMLVELFAKNKDNLAPATLRKQALEQLPPRFSHFEMLLRWMELYTNKWCENRNEPIIGRTGLVDVSEIDLEIVRDVIDLIAHSDPGMWGDGTVESRDRWVRMSDNGVHPPSGDEVIRLRENYFFELFDFERFKDAHPAPALALHSKPGGKEASKDDTDEDGPNEDGTKGKASDDAEIGGNDTDGDGSS